MLKIRCRVEVRVVFRVRVSFFLSIQWRGGGGEVDIFIIFMRAQTYIIFKDRVGFVFRVMVSFFISIQWSWGEADIFIICMHTQTYVIFKDMVGFVFRVRVSFFLSIQWNGGGVRYFYHMHAHADICNIQRYGWICI